MPINPMNPGRLKVSAPTKGSPADWMAAANTFQFPFTFVDGHVVMQVGDQQVLVDTGAQQSVGGAAEWEFLNQKFPLAQEYEGVTIQGLAEWVGRGVDILLGADVLSTRPFLIDPSDKCVVFPFLPAFDGTVLAVSRMLQGVPVVGILAGDVKVDAVLDTGAKLSYLDNDLAVRFPQGEDQQDFYPGIGRFTTPTHQADIQLAGEQITLRCGVLPSTIDSLLRKFGVRGIIGTEVLRHYALGCNLPGGTIHLRPFGR